MRMVTGSRRLAVGLGALVVVLAGTGTAVATNIGAPASDRQDLPVGGQAASAAGEAIQSPEVVSVPGPPTAPLPLPGPTTGPSPATVPRPPTPAAAPSPTSTTPESRPTSAAHVTPPGPAAPRWPAISPDHGTASTLVTVSGGGCVGEGAGVRLFITHPDGVETNGYGGEASADGTWSYAGATYPHQVPGRYAFEPKCVRGGATVIFAYQPVFYSMSPSSNVPPGGEPRPPVNLPSSG